MTHYSGLCRICTEYDSGGGVKEPVHRIKSDEEGNEIKSLPPKQREPYDLALMKQKFVDGRRKKMTKRQKAVAAEQAKALIEAQQEIEAEADGAKILEIGESVGDEEE